MNRQPGILLYFDLLNTLEHLSNDELGEMIRAASHFVQYQERPSFHFPACEIYWPFVLRDLMRDMDRYQAKVEKSLFQKDPEYARLRKLMDEQEQ